MCHIVWITKYRYKILTKSVNERIRTIIAEVSEEMEAKMENGVLSSDHLYLFVVISPHVAVSDFVQRAKGRSLRKVQQEFPGLKKIYWKRLFWERDTLVLLSGRITDEAINEYIINIRIPISLTVYPAQELLTALPTRLTTFRL